MQNNGTHIWPLGLYWESLSVGGLQWTSPHCCLCTGLWGRVITKTLIRGHNTAQLSAVSSPGLLVIQKQSKPIQLRRDPGPRKINLTMKPQLNKRLKSEGTMWIGTLRVLVTIYQCGKTGGQNSIEWINEAFKWVIEALIGADKMGQHFQCQNYSEVTREKGAC